jgi:hypothetical protein
MKEDDRIISTKGDKKDSRGTIIRCEGTGHARKWRIRWDDGTENLVHAKSFKLLENSDDESENSEEDQMSVEADDSSNHSSHTESSYSTEISSSESSSDEMSYDL